MNFFQRLKLAWKFVWIGVKPPDAPPIELTDFDREISKAFRHWLPKKYKLCDWCGWRRADYTQWNGKGKCNTCSDRGWID